MTVVGQGATITVIAIDRNGKQVIFENCAPFWLTTSVNNTKDLDIAMPMYDLIECSDDNAEK